MTMFLALTRADRRCAVVAVRTVGGMSMAAYLERR
jgi:hypothetical protein